MTPPACRQPNCDRPGTKALGYCNGHYLRQRRGSDMEPPIRDIAATDEERFWRKVEKTETCWVWTAAIFNGYGAFRYQGTAQPAHRVAYAWRHGPIPPGIELDHMCHNRACVNPDHLRPATKVLNGQNRSGLNRNNTSGVRGVYWATGAGCWIAKGYVNRKPVNVGRFDNLEDAERAITEWRRNNMPYSINDQERKVS